jgi:hypothetical protein
MKKQKPDPEFCYLSNNGKGPLEAKVIEIAQDENRIVLERRHKNARRNTAIFELPLNFFLSPKCGWLRVQRT